MSKFTVEEINFMCVFETQNRMKMMEEIRRIMPHIKGKGQILRSTPNTAPLICGACNIQPEGLLTTA